MKFKFKIGDWVRPIYKMERGKVIKQFEYKGFNYYIVKFKNKDRDIFPQECLEKVEKNKKRVCLA